MRRLFTADSSSYMHLLSSGPRLIWVEWLLIHIPLLGTGRTETFRLRQAHLLSSSTLVTVATSSYGHHMFCIRVPLVKRAALTGKTRLRDNQVCHPTFLEACKCTSSENGARKIHSYTRWKQPIGLFCRLVNWDAARSSLHDSASAHDDDRDAQV